MVRDTVKNTVILCSPTSEDMRPNLDKNKGMFFPPLGLLLVAQSLKNAGYEILFYDGNFDIDYKEKIINYLSKNENSILFIGFYLTLLQIKDMRDIVKSIKALNNDIKIVVGGPFPAVFPKITIDSGLVDIACIGDGAKVAKYIADYGLNKEFLKQVPNICFKYNDGVIINQRTIRDELNEQNRINYLDFIDIEGYVEKFRLYLPSQDPMIKRAVPILTGLGCSYKCSFCENALLNHKHISMSAEDIIEQIRFYHENYNIDSFAFFDEDFFFDKRRLLKLMEFIEKSSLKIKWGSQCRVNYFNEGYVNTEFLGVLEKSGCVRLAMGVESGSPAMLKKLRKGIMPEQVIRAAEYGKDSPIIFSYSLMVNLPEETIADISMTAELMDKLLSTKKNSFVSAVHSYFAYPGTPLSSEMEKKLSSNPLRDLNFEKFAEFNLDEYNKKINPVKTDYRKDCLVFYGLKSKVPQQFQFNLRSIARILLLKFVGQIRKSMNFYSIPVEMYLKNWVRQHIGNLVEIKSKKSVKNSQ